MSRDHIDPLRSPGATPARTCPACQDAFIPAEPASRQVYCSTDCRTQAHRRPVTPDTRTCPVCEADFSAHPSIRQIYCSTDCRKEADLRREHDRNQARARRLGETPRPPAPTTPRPASRVLPPPPPPSTDPLQPTAIRNCPHCDQPVTIVALLATPEAARPTIPQIPTDIRALRRH